MIPPRKTLAPIGLVLALLAVAPGCSKDYEAQVSELEAAVRSAKIGQSQDVWLIKLNAFGEREKTALFFGYWDDFDACYDMAALYMQRYPSDSYSCGYAN